MPPVFLSPFDSVRPAEPGIVSARSVACARRISPDALCTAQVYPGPSSTIKTDAVASIDPMHHEIREFAVQCEEQFGPQSRPSRLIRAALAKAQDAKRLTHFHNLPDHLRTSAAAPPGAPVKGTQQRGPGPGGTLAGPVKKKKSRVQGNWGK